MSEAVRLKELIKSWLEDVGLLINEEKSNTVYIDTLKKKKCEDHVHVSGL